MLWPQKLKCRSKSTRMECEQFGNIERKKKVISWKAKNVGNSIECRNIKRNKK